MYEQRPDQKTILPPMLRDALQSENPAFDWGIPDILSGTHQPLKTEMQYRFFCISEISEDKAANYRLAMSNVLSILNGSDASIVYLLSGRPEGVSLYLGVAQKEGTGPVHESAPLLESALSGNFPGIILNAVKQDDETFSDLFANSRHLGCVMGVPSFNEQQQDGEQDFQGIERLVNSLQGETWQLMVVAEPGKDEELRQQLEALYELSTALSVHAKQSVQQSEGQSSNDSTTTGSSNSTTAGSNESVGKTHTEGINSGYSSGKSKSATKSSGESGSSWNTSTSTQDGSNEGTNSGTNTSDGVTTSSGKNFSKTTGSNDSKTWGSSSNSSIALTRERINKNIEEMQKHLGETVIERFRLGRSKGMFRTAIYLSAPDARTWQRLAHSVRSIFQGNQASSTPLQIHKLPEPTNTLDQLLQLRRYTNKSKTDPRTLLAHGVPFDMDMQQITAATWFNTQELALIAGLPSRELPGITLRKSVEFAVNIHQSHNGNTLNLGKIVQHGRELPGSSVPLPVKDLNKHVFITGVTGAGKTTTCMKLLLESGLPFLVIEPAKTEYRALYAQGHEDVDYYLPGRDDISVFRLNPFELVHPRQNLQGHIAILASTLTAVYPMEAAMPQLVEEAIIAAYKRRGWDIYSGENLYTDNAWAEEAGGEYWPVFSDMLAELDELIQSKGMGKEFEEKYRGSLVARLTNLTLGIKGRMLNTRRSINFDALLDKKVVIELEEMKSEQDKALLMGLIITRLAECMKQRHYKTPGFQHLTLVEEAHRLLSRTEPGESDARKHGVEMFANLLAEVRKYGEGLIIADQIPNKLIPDVIKNTHTKIVHRLFAADDRKTIGDAMSLDDEQKDFLPLLQAGETIMYCGGWHAPVRVKIEARTKTDHSELPEEKLQQKGRQQLWQEYRQLFPAVAALGMLGNAEQLSILQAEGNTLLSLFREYVHNKPGKNSDDTDKKEDMDFLRQRYQQKYRLLQQRLETCEQNLSKLLFALLLDTQHLPKKLRHYPDFLQRGQEFFVLLHTQPEVLEERDYKKRLDEMNTHF